MQNFLIKKPLRIDIVACMSPCPSAPLSRVSLYLLILDVIHARDSSVSFNAKTSHIPSSVCTASGQPLVFPLHSIWLSAPRRHSSTQSQLDHLDQVFFWTVPRHSLHGQVSPSFSSRGRETERKQVRPKRSKCSCSILRVKLAIGAGSLRISTPEGCQFCTEVKVFAGVH